MNLMKRPSSHLMYPDMTPISVPRIRASSIAVIPTDSDARPPAMTRARVSRPSWSVPSGWANVGPRLRARMSMNCGSIVQIIGPNETAATTKTKKAVPKSAPL